MGYGVFEELERRKKQRQGQEDDRSVQKSSSTPTLDDNEYGVFRELREREEKREEDRKILNAKSDRNVSLLGDMGPVRGGAGGRIFDEETRIGQGRKSKNGVRKSINGTIGDDEIGPTWFQKGALEDGVTFKNVGRAILGTLGDAGESFTSGLLGLGEQFLDGSSIIGTALNNQQMMQMAESELITNMLMGKDVDGVYDRYAAMQKDIEDAAAEFIAKDLYDEDAIVKAKSKKLFGVDVDEYSVFGQKMDEVLASTPQTLVSKAAGAAVPGLGETLTFLFSAGGEAENAFNNGATFREALLSSTLTASAEVLTEKISGGISLGGKTLDSAVPAMIASGVGNKFVQSLAKFGVDVAGEGAEEVLSGWLSALGQKLTYEDDKKLKEIFSSQDAWDSFIGGAIMGGLFDGMNIPASKIKGQDFVTGMTANERKVVDKVYKDALSKKSGKITQKEKTDLFNSIVDQMEKGFIETDTIEEVLGGETYQAYKDTSESEEALRKELEELRKMKKGDMNDIQMERLEELKKMNLSDSTKQSDLQKKLREEVLGRIRNDRLMESYNERGRRSQAFEADLSQYEEKQREVVRKAMESGILNNTNRTHQFVDLVAKISADKGVPFSFTNNEKLKETGFALDGKTVNGYLSKDGVAVNIQSAKALNTVVGHEIAHVLEGTELYQPMQEMLFKYSQAKGDYQSRVDSLTKLYEGIEGADINAELTADLIGDYLFTDEAFIQRLSVENRTAFEKILDEVKYMCRVATAGSKQARELERIKKTFEEIYRGDTKNPTADGGVKYDLSDGTTKDATELSRNDLHYLLESAQNGVLSDSSFIPLRRNTPEFFIGVVKEHSNGEVVIEDYPMAATVEHLRQNMDEDDGQSYGRARPHGFSVDDIVTISEKMGDPSYIVLQRNGRYAEVVSFYNGRNKLVVVAIDLADSISPKPKNYKHSQYMNGYGDGYYNIIVTQFEPDSLEKYLQNNEVVYSKKEMNGKYQVGSGRIVTITHDTPFIEDIIAEKRPAVNSKLSLSENAAGRDEEKNIFGTYNVFGEDVALETQLTGEKSTENQGNSTDDLGPVQEDLKKAPADPTVIDMRLERDKAALEAAYQAKREKMEAEVADKDAYIKKKAKALYDEISVLKKGIKASDQLSYLLDVEKDWSRIKSALINIQHTPDRQVNIHSQIEEDARKLLDLDYEDRLMDINDLEAELAVNMTNLDAEAAMEKAGEGGENAEIRKSVSDKIVKQIIAAQTELDNNRRFRQQAIDDYDTQIAEAKAELEGKKNQDSKVAQTLRQRIERLSRMKTDIVVDYDARIEKQEARVEKLNSKEYSRAEYRRAKQEEYSNMWEDMLGDTSKWKDMKIGLQYKTKTLRRILRRVVRDSEGKPDFAKADRIYDELETKYDHHEAELKRESQRLKEVFFKLNLSHAEDTYAHMMGELLYNPQTKLSQETVDEYYEKHKNKIDTAKVDMAIKEARKTFDELITRVNKVLREQGLQEIPYRQGYFPHFTSPKQNFVQKLFNWKPIDTEIPTSIAGLTEAFKPQRSWQSFNKQRQSDTTDYSLYQGLDSYIHGALDWIYHIEDLQKRRELENYIRYIHSEEHIKKRIEEIKASDVDADEAQRQINAVLEEARNPLGGLVRELMNRTNTLANKKSAMDRGMEDATNRKIYSTMTNLNNRINANMVVGSLSSALTNFIPMVQSWHQVSPYYTVKGMGDFVRSVIVDDGTVEKSDFLTNRLVEEENLYRTGWDKVSDKAGLMMDVIDNITSQTVWRSKYLQNLDEGMGESAAIKDADQFAKNLMAGRSRGNAPSIFDAKNPIIKIATAFQLEVANQYGYMFEDVPQDTKNKAKLVKGYAAAFTGAYLYNALYSSLVGRDAAFDPIGIIEDLMKGLFDDEEEPVDTLMEFGGNILDEVPFISGLTGGGRIPISSALPYSGDQTPFASMLNDVAEGNWDSFGKELLKPIYYLAMPVAGGQLKKTVEGLSMFDDDLPTAGSYTDSGKLRFTVEDTFGNRAKAALFGQYANANARDYFDNGRSALSDQQIEEFMASGMKIQDYWDYREGLKDHDTLDEKADYIAGLDLPISTKNMLVNNLTDREDPIDLAVYDQYEDFEEMDFAIKSPEKYKFLKSVGIPVKEYLQFDEATKEEYDFRYKSPEKYEVALRVGGYQKYKRYAEAMKDMELAQKADYIAGLDLTTEQKNVLINSETDRKEPIDLTGYEKYSSFEEFEYAKKNPEGYAVAKVMGGYEAYTAYSQALGDIKADKDKFGNSISGSRKTKVQAYIDGLDADYYTKLLLYKSQYNSYDDENYEIVEFINSRKDLTFNEKIVALRKIGFDVDAKGNIYW